MMGVDMMADGFEVDRLLFQTWFFKQFGKDNMFDKDEANVYIDDMVNSMFIAFVAGLYIRKA